jgi:hypothetical protein
MHFDSSGCHLQILVEVVAAQVRHSFPCLAAHQKRYAKADGMYHFDYDADLQAYSNKTSLLNQYNCGIGII